MHIAPELRKQWERLNSGGKAGLMDALSITITEVNPGLVKASMPVSDVVKQPLGVMHGGASLVLAESVSSLGSWMLIDADKERAVGLEINANHLRSATRGTVFAEASIVHQGKRTHVWQISITDDEQRPVCISRCTIAIVS